MFLFEFIQQIRRVFYSSSQFSCLWCVPVLMCCTQSWTKKSSFFLYCVCLGLKYGLHLFVNQKLKKTIKLDQLQRHGHKLSLTSASNTHSFYLAFEISKASNTHTNQRMPKGQMSYKVDMLSILQYTANVQIIQI